MLNPRTNSWNNMQISHNIMATDRWIDQHWSWPTSSGLSSVRSVSGHVVLLGDSYVWVGELCLLASTWMPEPQDLPKGEIISLRCTVLSVVTMLWLTSVFPHSEEECNCHPGTNKVFWIERAITSVIICMQRAKIFIYKRCNIYHLTPNAGCVNKWLLR